MNDVRSATRSHIKSIFMHEGKLDFFVAGLFILINLVVLTNAILHHPKIGYDTVAHLTYIQVLADRLPEPQDTLQSYSPPLSYVLPMIFDTVCESFVDPETYIQYRKGSIVTQECRFWDGKVAQFINVLISMATVYFILLISEYVKPGNRWHKISALMLFALLTVHYKTFSQVRPEPYVALFSIISIYYLLRLFDINNPSPKPVAALGISLGLLSLTRQWGFFIFVAAGVLGIWLFLQDRQSAIKLIKPLAISILISAVIGGWFYVHSYIQYGTLTGFYLKESTPLSLSQFLSAARRTHFEDFDIFKQPVRPNFDESPSAIFYSDTWGDYWGYFTYIKERSPQGEQGLGNSEEMGAYLGRVNFFSIIPTAILVIGWLMAAIKLFRFKKPLHIEQIGSALFFFVTLVSIIGFTVYLLNYFGYANNVLKASYMLQFFMAAILLGADFLASLQSRAPRFYYFTLVALGIVFIHNLPAFITRYILFPYP